MPALLKLQEDFLGRVLREESPDGLPISPEGPFTPEQRLSVYKNNTHLILRDLIKDSFPVTTVLLGDKFVNFAAHEFIRGFPPAGGDMNGYGGGFPEFLRAFPGLDKFPYVPDVAKLEWLAHETYLSPRLPTLTGEMMAAAEDPMSLKLKPQPHIQLLRSAWPVEKLWTAVSEQGENLKDFEMKAEDTWAVLYRENRKVAIWTITEGGYRFLEHLQNDGSLALAAEAAMRAEEEFPLDRFLAMLLQLELLAAE